MYLVQCMYLRTKIYERMLIRTFIYMNARTYIPKHAHTTCICVIFVFVFV